MNAGNTRTDFNFRTSHPRPVSKFACLLFPFLFLLCSPGISSADEAGSRAVNWAYQSSLGAGVYIGEQEDARIYNLPLSHTFRDINEAGWALKLTLPLTVGIYNIQSADRDINVDVTSVVPGFELHMPVRDNWVLIPFAGFGVGKDTSGGKERYLYSLGIKHYVYFPWETVDFTFGNTLRHDGLTAGGGGNRSGITSLRAGLDARFPMGFNFPLNPGYLSIYGVFLHYFDRAIALYTEEKDFEMKDQGEFGITLSSIPSWKIWRLSIDRLGIGYRSGDRISTLRVVFGMPF